MKKSSLIISIFIAISFQLSAQITDTLECDAPENDTTEAELLPWFGNNDYLENFLDSIGYDNAGRIVGVDQVRYHVPIKFWVYRSTAGIGGPNLRQLRDYIDNLNRFYNTDNNTKIGFYMKCEIGYINNDDHLEVGYVEAASLIQGRKEQGCINVHIANDLRNASGVQIRTRFFGIDGIFVDASTYLRTDLASTLSHEVGHYFQLYHTHRHSNRGSCRKEAIDRNRNWPTITICPFGGGLPISTRICEATGDLLRDTPADPDLDDNDNCNYLLTGLTDPWGDSYEAPPQGSAKPDTRNILSYNGDRSCRNVFSRLQIAVMLYSIERGKSNNNATEWKNTKAIYDSYEMDNFAEAARPIVIGEVQERTFHEQYIKTGAVWTQCDVDWVRFIAPCSAVFSVYTAAIPLAANANTRLTLYDNNLNQLAQNNNIAPGNLFSRIQFNFIQGNEYFIRVDNMGSQGLTYYTLQIDGAAISGPEKICNAETYSVGSLPSGATITWSASPAGLVSFSPVGPTTSTSTTVTRIADGMVTITATINVCGGTVVTSTKTVSSGLTYFPHSVSGPAIIYPTSMYYYTLQVPLGMAISNIVWTVPSGWSINLGQGTTHATITTGTTSGDVQCSFNDECGLTWNTYLHSEIGTGGPAPLRVGITPPKFTLGVSPNPASENVFVSIISDKSNSTKSTDIPGIKEIRIGNKTGDQQRTYKFAGGNSSEKINVGQLPSDVYIIQVFTGKEWLSTRLIITGW